MTKTAPDTGTLIRKLDRLRDESDALLIVAVRVDDVAFSVDPGVSPQDAEDALRGEIPNMVKHLVETRKKARHEN